MSIDRVPGAPASNVALAQSATRPTPTPIRPGVTFGAVLAATTKPLSAAMNALPGSSVIATAVRNGPQITLSAGGTSAGTLGGVGMGGGLSAGGPGTGGVGVGVSTGGAASTGDPATDMMAMQQQLLAEQVAVQSASESFTSQSNILNAEHSAKMAAIQNLRA